MIDSYKKVMNSHEKVTSMYTFATFKVSDLFIDILLDTFYYLFIHLQTYLNII